MAKRKIPEDRFFLLNQLKSGLGFINQSIAVCRHLRRDTLADFLSVTARRIDGAMRVAEDESAWDEHLCHGNGQTAATPTDDKRAAAERGPICGPPDATADDHATKRTATAI